MKAAVKSENLVTRASTNRRFGEADFDSWVLSLLADISFTSVLDLCCGTGSQLVLFAQRPEVERVIGVDLSVESLDIARGRLESMGAGGKATLEASAMETAFDLPSIAKHRFDLASCFYGLYYAREPGRVLESMVDHLSAKGTVIIVGPHGANNASLFGLLQRHFELPELVIRSATTFMEEEVVPVLLRRLAVETRTFVNPIHYPGRDELLNYWRASTFYRAEHEEAVARDVEVHFRNQPEFVVEKHVMAAIGRKEAI